MCLCMVRSPKDSIPTENCKIEEEKEEADFLLLSVLYARSTTKERSCIMIRYYANQSVLMRIRSWRNDTINSPPILT